ncbi:hypothetical protein JYT51_01165 [Candidatus Amoebophilus asiaticus]|nr:hypothetical protein [Candidatus Amoebophilus asiaticus]
MSKHSIFKYMILIYSFILFKSCEIDPPIYIIENLNGNKISVFGHAGMGELYKYPANTFESIEPLLRIGGEGSEIDVQITKDSILVLYHNDNLNSNTNCDGVIHDKLWSEMGNCSYNALLSQHIYVITVDNLFGRINNLENYTFTLDCKFETNSSDLNSYYHQYANAIINIIEKYQIEDMLFIESTSTDFLQVLKNKNVKAKLFITGLASINDGIKIAKEIGCRA